MRLPAIAIALTLALVSGVGLMARFFADPAATPEVPAVLYAAFNGKDLTSGYAIGVATRTNGVWAEYGSNPVLSPTTSGWDDTHVKDPCLVWDGSQYVMFYSGHDGTNYQIGVATAPAHTGPWTRDAGNPVLALGSGGTFDDEGLSFATVLYEPADTGKEWKVWYLADDGTTETIAYAYASNPEGPYTKVGVVLSPGTSGQWDDVGVLPAAIVKDGSTYYLFYGGRQGVSAPSDPPRWQGGVATFTDPEGTYSKHGSNPTLAHRRADSSTTVVPTADVTEGATTVALSDTSPFDVGEPVAIADGDTTAHIGYIASIDSGTQLSLDRAVVGNFTGGGKVFRSFAYNSVVPRSVLPRVGGGYEMIGTPFQPVDDLTQPASKLWEGSFEWRASTLTGTWDYYYVAGRGLLFPLITGAAWHQRSAENPSVIPAP